MASTSRSLPVHEPLAARTRRGQHGGAGRFGLLLALFGSGFVVSLVQTLLAMRTSSRLTPARRDPLALSRAAPPSRRPSRSRRRSARGGAFGDQQPERPPWLAGSGRASRLWSSTPWPQHRERDRFARKAVAGHHHGGTRGRKRERLEQRLDPRRGAAAFGKVRRDVFDPARQRASAARSSVWTRPSGNTNSIRFGSTWRSSSRSTAAASAADLIERALVAARDRVGRLSRRYEVRRSCSTPPAISSRLVPSSVRKIPLKRAIAGSAASAASASRRRRPEKITSGDQRHERAGWPSVDGA